MHTFSRLILITFVLTLARIYAAEPVWQAEFRSNYSQSPNAYSNQAALDSHDNLIVVGSSDTLNEDESDVRVLKYSRDGKLLFDFLYHQNNFYWEMDRIGIDRDDNILIGGGVTPSSGNEYYAFMKLDPKGNLLWVKYPESVANTGEVAFFVDPEGNSIMATLGYSKLIEYDKNGNLKNVVALGTSESIIRLYGIAGEGETLWLAGWGYSPALNKMTWYVGRFDIPTLKSDWEIIGNDEQGNPVPMDIALSVTPAPDGGVFVAGADVANYDITTGLVVRFDRRGHALWHRSVFHGIGPQIAYDPVREVLYHAGMYYWYDSNSDCVKEETTLTQLDGKDGNKNWEVPVKHDFYDELDSNIAIVAGRLVLAVWPTPDSGSPWYAQYMAVDRRGKVILDERYNSYSKLDRPLQVLKTSHDEFISVLESKYIFGNGYAARGLTLRYKLPSSE